MMDQKISSTRKVISGRAPLSDQTNTISNANEGNEYLDEAECRRQKDRERFAKMSDQERDNMHARKRANQRQYRERKKGLAACTDEHGKSPTTTQTTNAVECGGQGIENLDPADRKRQYDREWYAILSDQKKEENRARQREYQRRYRERKKAEIAGAKLVAPTPSAPLTSIIGVLNVDQTCTIQSTVTHLVKTTTVEIATQESQQQYGANACESDDENWLRRNDAYIRLGTQAFDDGHCIEILDSAERRKQRRRLSYDQMSEQEKEAKRRKQREYRQRKKDESPMWTPQSATIGHVHQHQFGTKQAEVRRVQHSANNTSQTHMQNIGDDELFDSELWEPDDTVHNIDKEDLDRFQPIEDGADIYEDDEARVFTKKDVQYESYRVAGAGIKGHNPYDEVYKDLPRKHHILKTVPIYNFCGAKRFEGEGSAFCCRKGNVNICIPKVPDELRRLFTGQTDEDAKYFRKNIRYFNSHFSFTSLGVTLDRRLANAAGSGIYTFRAHSQIYHKLDQLVPRGNGPRHMQLYFYDIDDNIGHRMERSPHLDTSLIRKIL